MSDRAAIVPPHAGINAAMGPRTRGALPPVCPPPANPPRESSSSPLLWPWCRPIHQVSTPAHYPHARGFSSEHLANPLVKRPRLY